MRALTVDVKSSTGRVLCCTVFRPGGKKLLAKGHVISDEDVRVLESEGMESIWVTDLRSSTGRVLCCTVFRPGGKKLLAKGHVISDEDVRVLESEGMESIWVTEL